MNTPDPTPPAGGDITAGILGNGLNENRTVYGVIPASPAADPAVEAANLTSDAYWRRFNVAAPAPLLNETTEIIRSHYAPLVAEVERLRAKADECWGAANYRLKYIGCLFRAAGLDDSDPMEPRVGEAAEHIEKLVAENAALKAQVAAFNHEFTAKDATITDLRAQLAEAQTLAGLRHQELCDRDIQLATATAELAEERAHADNLAKELHFYTRGNLLAPKIMTTHAAKRAARAQEGKL